MDTQLTVDRVLRSHGLKATPQRIVVLEELEAVGHANITDLLARIKMRLPSMTLTTLYKCIASLTSANLVRQVGVVDDTPQYEIEKGSHIHFRCSECGALEDVPGGDDVADAIARVSGKEFDDYSVYVTGLCDNCK